MTTPGKDHVSHRLARVGWTRREVVLLLYLAGCALGGIAAFVSLADPTSAYLITSAVVVLAVGALVRLEQLVPVEDLPTGPLDTRGGP